MHPFVSAWAVYLDIENGRMPTTVKRYIRVLEDFIAFLTASPETSELPLEEVGKRHLRHFLRDYAQRGGHTSRSTWNLGLAALRSFYGFLFEEEVIDLNPAMRVRRRKFKRGREPLPLSLDEFLTLTEDAMERGREWIRARNIAIAAVFFHGGLRATELVSLNQEQVDFANGLLRNFRIKGDSWLSADLNEEVAVALNRYLRERHRFGAPADERALFLSERGQRMSVRAVQEMVKVYAKRAGINRPVGPHLLRHSFATVLADDGVPVPVIQAKLGHKQITTTYHYLHVRDPAKRKASARLGQIVTDRRHERHQMAA